MWKVRKGGGQGNQRGEQKEEKREEGEDETGPGFLIFFCQGEDPERWEFLGCLGDSCGLIVGLRPCRVCLLCLMCLFPPVPLWLC